MELSTEEITEEIVFKIDMNVDKGVWEMDNFCSKQIIDGLRDCLEQIPKDNKEIQEKIANLSRKIANKIQTEKDDLRKVNKQPVQENETLQTQINRVANDPQKSHEKPRTNNDRNENANATEKLKRENNPELRNHNEKKDQKKLSEIDKHLKNEEIDKKKFDKHLQFLRNKLEETKTGDGAAMLRVKLMKLFSKQCKTKKNTGSSKGKERKTTNLNLIVGIQGLYRPLEENVNRNADNTKDHSKDTSKSKTEDSNNKKLHKIDKGNYDITNKTQNDVTKRKHNKKKAVGHKHASSEHKMSSNSSFISYIKDAPKTKLKNKRQSFDSNKINKVSKRSMSIKRKKRTKETNKKGAQNTLNDKQDADRREDKMCEKMQVLDLEEHFNNVHEINVTENNVESIENIKKTAETFQDNVENYRGTNYSVEYFIMDENLMRLLELLDRIKCHDNENMLKKKLDTITYIKSLHQCLDNNVINDE